MSKTRPIPTKKIEGKSIKSTYETETDFLTSKLEATEINYLPLSALEETELEKIILYGESGSGKTRWYLTISNFFSMGNLPPEHFLMCVLNPDRRSGVSKLISVVPKEYRDRIYIFECNTYEEIWKATRISQKLLDDHLKKTKIPGWFVCELLNEVWMYAQDYYSRMAYSESLGEYFAKRRMEVLRRATKPDEATAYRALEGWGDWPVIKYFHNYYWIDQIKRFPHNVLFTAECREENDAHSIFSKIGYRPAGEKDNIHRVDTIIYLSHIGDTFKQQALKLTGFSRLYGVTDITNKTGLAEHYKMLEKLEKKGFKIGKRKELIQSTEKKLEKKPEFPKVENFELEL